MCHLNSTNSTSHVTQNTYLEAQHISRSAAIGSVVCGRCRVRVMCHLNSTNSMSRVTQNTYLEAQR